MQTLDMEKPPKKLLEQTRDRLRLKHYSIRTERAYVDWIKRYILFHDKKHPEEMGAKEIEEFLTHLAVKRKVAPSTQNQALNAIIFLYREILELEDHLNRVKLLHKDDLAKGYGKVYLPYALEKKYKKDLHPCAKSRGRDREKSG
jgi:hypothetical protein